MAEAGGSTESTQRQVDLAFAMDCTGSMSSYIQQARENIRIIAEEIVGKEKVDLRFALVEYRDHPPQDQSFVTNVLDFTDRLREMKARLDQCSAAGGGDTPEAVADALHAVLKLSWRQTAVKICVFIADAPPHGLGCHGDAFETGCPSGLDPMVTAREMAEKEISVYTVGCEPAICPYRDWFMAISHITSGQYVPLGSAKLLSQVIIGGAVEEISLASLMPEVEAQIQQMVVESNGAIDQDEIDKKVYEKFKGSKTRAVQSNVGTLQQATTQAVQLAQLNSMAEVRGVFRPERDTSSWKESASVAAYGAADSEFSMHQATRMVRKTLAKSKMSYK